MGRRDPEPVALYRCLVGGRQRFFETSPGDTVDLELTERQLAGYLETGVVAESEPLDEGADSAPADSVQIADSASVLIHEDEDDLDPDPEGDYRG